MSLGQYETTKVFYFKAPIHFPAISLYIFILTHLLLFASYYLLVQFAVAFVVFLSLVLLERAFFGVFV